ncbi:MAG: glycosyltransferase family 1 protein [Bacilli bacterium]|nr:glycosyltransferase family 1 protein [Bacilli bacterium]
MKIVVSGYIGKKITGIGRNLISLLDASDNENMKYVIYTNYDMADEMKFKNKNVVVKTYSVSKNSSMKNLLWTTFVFPFIVLKEKADKALIPNFTLLLFKFRPTYVILHDLIEFNVPDKFSKNKMFYRTKIADPITAHRANEIITDSKNSKNDIMKFLKIRSEKIHVIYNGVDNNKFCKMEPSKANKIIKQHVWPYDFILYVGTIDHPGKNAMSVVKVFEQLKKEYNIPEKLVLAGMPGQGFEIVKEYIEKSKYKNEIIITGYISDECLVALYSSCKTFCFVSLYEGFGIPPLEALSCGAKVVVSNNSSLPEVVGKLGWKADPYSIESIKHEVYESLKFDIDLNYTNSVIEHLNNFKWSNLTKKLEKLFLE